MSEYFPKPKSLEANVKVKSDLPNELQILKMQQMLIHHILLRKLI